MLRRNLILGLAALLAVVLSAERVRAQAATPARGPVIRLARADDPSRAAFEVAGLDPAVLSKLADWKPEQWLPLFTVQVASDRPEEDDKRPAVLGSIRVAGGVVQFEPRFPLSTRARYRVRFDPSRLPGWTGDKACFVQVFALPKLPPAAPAVVERVFPSRDRLPENQLKFYIHFSAPMRQGDVYKHVHLLNASGKEIESPFLELGEELWDPANQRFTLFIDPGRIKRGLKPREDLGPVLEAGKEYTLVIDRQWEDAGGTPLKETYRKRFKAGPEDDQPIEPKSWKLLPPAARKPGPLIVVFPEPLDHALLHRLLWVIDAGGRKVPGTVKVTEDETRWLFTPDTPWQVGAYQLIVDTTLEDLAGNRIGEPFEVDVFRTIQRAVKTKTVALPFQVKDE